MPCSPRSSTGCCTCRAQGRRTLSGATALASPAPGAPHSQEPCGTGSRGSSTVTQILQLDQVRSHFPQHAVCLPQRTPWLPSACSTKVNPPDVLRPRTTQASVPGSLGPHSLMSTSSDGSPTVPRALKFQILSLSLPWRAFPGWRSHKGGQCFPSRASVSPCIKQGRGLTRTREGLCRGQGRVALVPHEVPQGLSTGGRLGHLLGGEPQCPKPLTCHC